MTGADRDRALVLGCEIDRVRMNEAVALCRAAVEQQSFLQHMALNAAKIVSLRADSRLREAVAGSELVTADGQSLVWASRLLRDPLPERVAGIDLMEELFALSEREGYRIYLLGATPDTLARAIERLLERHPNLSIAGSQHGYFSEGESGVICERIRAVAPDVLFVAMSSPRKEYWLAEHGRALGVPMIMGVGGALDVIAGDVLRAPRWAQVTGFEWAWRVAQEPRRLWRRYLVTNTRFIVLVAREVLAGSLNRRARSGPPRRPRSTRKRDARP